MKRVDKVEPHVLVLCKIRNLCGYLEEGRLSSADQNSVFVLSILSLF